MWSLPIWRKTLYIAPPFTPLQRGSINPDMYEFRFFAFAKSLNLFSNHGRCLLYLNLQQEVTIDLYWFSATGKSVYRPSSVNKNQPIFRHLCVCVFGFKRRFQQSFSHITTVSGCDRELNAHFYSAASLKYHVPDTWHDITPSHIILILGQPVTSSTP